MLLFKYSAVYTSALLDCQINVHAFWLIKVGCEMGSVEWISGECCLAWKSLMHLLVLFWVAVTWCFVTACCDRGICLNKTCISVCEYNNKTQCVCNSGRFSWIARLKTAHAQCSTPLLHAWYMLWILTLQRNSISCYWRVHGIALHLICMLSAQFLSCMLGTCSEFSRSSINPSLAIVMYMA